VRSAALAAGTSRFHVESPHKLAQLGEAARRVGDLVAFGLAGAYAWNISHHGFLMHPPPSFHYLA
jgi:hypothetical protein